MRPNPVKRVLKDGKASVGTGLSPSPPPSIRRGAIARSAAACTALNFDTSAMAKY